MGSCLSHEEEITSERISNRRLWHPTLVKINQSTTPHEFCMDGADIASRCPRPVDVELSKTADAGNQ